MNKLAGVGLTLGVIAIFVVLFGAMYLADRSDTRYYERKRQREASMIVQFNNKCDVAGIKEFKFNRGSRYATLTCANGRVYVILPTKG